MQYMQNKLISSEELAPTTMATTVQVRSGDTLVTDGPFAETKETLGGYYLIEADSLDEAIEWASRIGSAHREGRDPAGARQLGVPRIDDLARAYCDECARCIAILGRTRSSSPPSGGRVTARRRTPGHGSWRRRNRAIDRIRREQTLARKTELLARVVQLPDDEDAVIPDERLELIFACCHPALAADAHALTLSLVGGLTTPETRTRSSSRSC